MIWQVKNKRIEISIDGIFWEDFSENFYVKEVVKNLITGEEIVQIIIETSMNGETRFTLNRENLDKKIIPHMTKYGLTCLDDKDNAQIVLNILFETESNAKCRYVHSVLGYAQDNSGKDVFLLHKPIGTYKNSTYLYAKKTKPRGSFMAWKKAVQETILVRPTMQLALAIGASAPVAHLLLKKRVLSEVNIISLIGQSTTGKTTALRVMSSLWFSPDMLTDFNCTQNAFFQRMSQTKGLPILIDEASAVPEWDFTKVIYNMPTGRGKLRCASNGQLVEPAEFSGVVVITGENSLFAQTNENNGLYARMLELNLNWTRDKAHAEAINHYFSNNYGTAGVSLMQWIIQNEYLIKDMYNRHFKAVSEISIDSINNPVLRRLLKTVALILTSAEILNLSLGLDMDIDAVANLLICFLAKKNSVITNPIDDWFSIVKSFVLQNISKFKDEESKFTPSVIWGIKGVYDYKHVFWIDKNIFEKFVTEKMKVDLKKLKYHFAKKGWMVKTNSRHYIFNRKIDGIEMSCYGLLLNSNSLPNKKTSKYNITNNSNLKNLLG